jgi:hypothetical protein
MDLEGKEREQGRTTINIVMKLQVLIKAEDLFD